MQRSFRIMNLALGFILELDWWSTLWWDWDLNNIYMELLRLRSECNGLGTRLGSPFPTAPSKNKKIKKKNLKNTGPFFALYNLFLLLGWGFWNVTIGIRSYFKPEWDIFKWGAFRLWNSCGSGCYCNDGWISGISYWDSGIS